MDISKRTATIWLGVLLLISAFLHVINISYPARPIFDEVHFATYASDYVKGSAFFDIHPPLGKILYAAVIAGTATEPLGDTQFVAVRKYASSSAVDTISTDLTFAHFPYVPLRLLSALFGVLLPLVFFWFLRSIGVNRFAALVGVALVVFENAMLVETRLILMNGMYIVFGLAALAMFFDRKWNVAGGVMWGLSLAVKLIGVVFLGPLIAGYFIQQKSKDIRASHAIQFVIIGFIVFVSTFATIQNSFFTPVNRLNTWIAQGMIAPDALSLRLPHLAPAAQHFFLTLLESTFFVIGNTGFHGLAFTHPTQSPWYLWPVMVQSIPYYVDPANSARQITLTGNPVVWFGSTLAIIFALALLSRYGKRFYKQRDESVRPMFILLGGYIFALLPYMTIVRRSTFLYHYFPALLFAIGLLAYLFDRFLRSPQLAAKKKDKFWILGGFALLVLVGFALTAPVTYGFPAPF